MESTKLCVWSERFTFADIRYEISRSTIANMRHVALLWLWRRVKYRVAISTHHFHLSYRNQLVIAAASNQNILHLLTLWYSINCASRKSNKQTTNKCKWSFRYKSNNNSTLKLFILTLPRLSYRILKRWGFLLHWYCSFQVNSTVE